MFLINVIMYEKISNTLEKLRNKWDNRYLKMISHDYKFKDVEESSLAFATAKKLSDKIKECDTQIVAIDQELNGLHPMCTIRYCVYSLESLNELISDISRLMDDLDSYMYFNKKQIYGN